ncbi:YtxH domain-containing protein [bacterium]|nr:MAG: YtxH domain-containing protein [bacterium]
MSNNNGSMALAFIVGGLVGAGIALLYAPASGAETRKRIRKGVGDACDLATDKYHDALESLEESAGKVRQLAEDKKADIKAAYDAGKDAYYKSKERGGQSA